MILDPGKRRAGTRHAIDQLVVHGTGFHFRSRDREHD
jgi:hypothetical protein